VQSLRVLQQGIGHGDRGYVARSSYDCMRKLMKKLLPSDGKPGISE
jgi:hypothetical protein